MTCTLDLANGATEEKHESKPSEEVDNAGSDPEHAPSETIAGVTEHDATLPVLQTTELQHPENNN